MTIPGKIKPRPAGLNRYVFILGLMWTLFIGVSAALDVVQIRRDALKEARIQARFAYENDIRYREWAASHGGVYVPVTKETPPNPYLSHIPERDITTPSGRLLTLVNPAYMTRQVYGLKSNEASLHAHLTSLNPTMPQNAPDLWETRALQSFELGKTEVCSVELIRGKKYMRLMYPFITEEKCLKCHAAQGYRVGDVRGGISVSVPMEPFLAVERGHMLLMSLGHFMLWLAGLGGIVFGWRRLVRTDRERLRAEAELRRVNQDLESIVQSRTEELQEANRKLRHEVALRQGVAKVLRDSEARFRTITSSANDAILMMNSSADISFWNEAAEEIFGYPGEEAIGRKLYDLIVPPRYRENFKKAFPKFRKTGKGPVIGTSLDLTALKKDGTEFPVELSVSAVKVKGRWNAIGIVRDISRRKKIEAQLKEYTENLERKVGERTDELKRMNESLLQEIREREQLEKELVVAKEEAEVASRVKGEFLANVSHEIRTPLNAIVGMNYLLKQSDLTPRQVEYVEEMERASSNLQEIITNILDFSAIESGGLETHSAEFNLEDVLRNLAGKVATRTRKKGIAFNCTRGPEVPIRLIGDPTRLEKVLFHLADNAVKFTDSGQIQVAVDVAGGDEEGIMLRFSVQDTGIGLTEAQTGKLFRSFTQVDGSSTRKYGGVGLGLSICKRLVQMMEGEIGVESERGKGSTFFFTAKFGYRPDEDRQPAGEPPAARHAPISIQYLAPRIRELAGFLRINDLRAETVFEEIRESLRTARPEETHRFEECLKAFDFKDAFKSLHSLAGSLGIEL